MQILLLDILGRCMEHRWQIRVQAEKVIIHLRNQFHILHHPLLKIDRIYHRDIIHTYFI
jgi:hypothetical protein